MTPGAVPGGTLVLDSDGLAKAVRRDRELAEWLVVAREEDMRVITSAATLVEVIHPKINRAAFDWTISRIVVEPVTESIARYAAELLAHTGLHGHRHAIDAMLSATACAAPGPTVVLTADPDDIAMLCADAVTVARV